ncbi:MAG TPA: molybdenum cofactor biosynthesis protein MoaE [Terriglobales bacterium]|nr:molybdenum cofactor biosynthesis protein MoaE [Terriglobales bacterium]
MAASDFMQVRVLFFGMLKDWMGRTSDSLSLPDNARLGDVVAHYAALVPRIRDLAASIAMSVNQEYAPLDQQLHPGDEVALLPPVSGGSGRASIVREVIDSQVILQRIKRPEDGAVVMFDGVVRNHTRGRRTLYLDYEAYDAMALKKMEGLAEQAIAQFGVREVQIVHRLGRLEIGATSVLIVVASAHRAAAFEACRWLIDTLKRTVPIWKKESFADGAVWADGEPFPAEIPRAEGIFTEKSASKSNVSG